MKQYMLTIYVDADDVKEACQLMHEMVYEYTNNGIEPHDLELVDGDEDESGSAPF